MAVAPTGKIFKGFELDGESSKNYGVYITGEAVFNAPEREVEMVAIPGRSGAYALDKGRFENIEVTYPAGIFADTELDFARAVSDLRNYLCSKKGYCKLTDDYNPDEYRMAIYKSGLEVTPAELKAGEFDITFECQPQRYLMSGDTPLTVTDGDTILNPTLFESKPLLMIDGYGNIDLNGSRVTINNIEVGKIPICQLPYSKKTITLRSKNYLFGCSFDGDLLNTGDVISVARIDGLVEYYENGNSELINSSIYTESGTSMSYYTYDGLTYTYTGYGILGYRFLNMTFVKGTSKTYTRTTNFKLEYDSGGTPHYEYLEITMQVIYSGGDSFTVGLAVSEQVTTEYQCRYATINQYNNSKTFYGTSTKSALGAPLYVDCEIGEAYKYEGDALVSINDVASLPPELPVLSPGVNVIGCDNSVTQLEIVPRWWKV